ncbi:lysoplasmalogenase [Ascidiimonas sp. W6]|uniref:lysoplasmalogenase n=1 Tax=Ascidiimonas meishanensis TaxID=3128903 RepID=UPI0030EB1A8C
MILCTDLVFNNHSELQFLRVYSKPALSITLLLFYYLNSKNRHKKERILLILCLLCLLLGDIFLLEDSRIYSFPIGLFAFFMANIFYSMVLYRSANIEINKSYPFLVVSAIYLFAIFYLMYDKLNEYFVPVLIYIFAVLNMIQAAFLRYKVVNHYSFILVFTGALLFLFSESILALNMFYTPFPYKNFLIMFFYGVSQLLIILGILREQKKFRRFD